MTAEVVVRRFDVHADDAATLNTVLKVLGAVEDTPPPAVRFRPVRRLRVVEVRLSGPDSAVSAVRDHLARMHGVRVQDDRIEIPGDRRNGYVYPDRRALLRMGISLAATVEPPGWMHGPLTEVVVGIVDSGITVDHPALKDHLWTGARGVHGQRFIDGVSDDDITDQNGHGTMLAGAVLTAAGRAPSVRLMSAKFFDTASPPRADNAAAAIEFVVANGAHIIDLSWALGLGSPKLEKAVRYAAERALVVIAAGNYGSDNDQVFRVPARYAREARATTVTVMATDADDGKAWFSNYGRATVDLAAPGVDIVSTRRFLTRTAAAASREYRTFSGTSAAAAFVCGAAALLKSREPGLTPRALKDRLMETIDEVPALETKCVSGGRLNIGNALATCH